MQGTDRRPKGNITTDGEFQVDNETWIRRQDVVIWCLVNHHLQRLEALAALNWLNWLLTNRKHTSRVCLKCLLLITVLVRVAPTRFSTAYNPKVDSFP